MKPTISPVFLCEPKHSAHEQMGFRFRPVMLAKRINDRQAGYAFQRGPGQVVEIRIVEYSGTWQEPTWGQKTRMMKAISEGTKLPGEIGSLWVNSNDEARAMLLRFWRYGRFMPHGQREEEELTEEEKDRRWEAKMERRKAHRKREQLREAYEQLRKAGYTVNPDGTVTAPA